MTLLLASLACFLAGGAVSAALSLRSGRQAATAGAAFSLLGAALGLAGSLPAVLGAPPETFHAPWNVPLGAFDLRLDPLAGWFLAPTFVVTGLSALYGRAYLGHEGDHGAGGAWLFFNLLAASLQTVLLAANGVLFLVAWEVMSLASYFLVTHHDERQSVRQAGWLYLVATHLGTAFLLAFFILATGPDMALQAAGPAKATGLLFFLALVGFGTKAGLAPLHVWLPEAHPAAPSHVSAFMSGVMIKAGLYGILRTLTLLGPPAPEWGWALLLVGAATALLGVAMALGQGDLKRLLAYSSVENVGLIAVGIGLSLLGAAHGRPVVAGLAMAGALIHVWAHSALKSLLFFGAGAVLQQAGTGNLERLGGLARRMPATAAAFGVGAAGLAGVPPLGGFVGEFLILLAAFAALTGQAPGLVVPGVLAVGTVAGVSGLAVACFTRAFGAVFLGEPRNGAAEPPSGDPGRAMVGPMAAQAGLGLALGLAAPVAAGAAAVPAATLLGGEAVPVLDAAVLALANVALVSSGLLLATVALAAVRQALLAKRPVAGAPTWGCGYLAPTAHMQYTASSYARPLTDLFGPELSPRRRRQPVQGLFPGRAAVSSRSSDPVLDRLFLPAFERLLDLAARFRWIQHGRLQFYVLYILLTLVGLFLWGLG